MATYTDNYNLAKPDLADPVDVTVLNDNYDIIDEAIMEAAESAPDIATTEEPGIVKPDGVSITVDNDGTIHGAQTYHLPIAGTTTLGGIKVGENLVITLEGKLNALPGLDTDAVPTPGSQNVPLSGGTYTMINNLLVQVSTLSTEVESLVTGINWLAAVDTYSEIASTYPNPSEGDTVMCLDTGYAYMYNGSSWIVIFTSLIATASVSDVEDVLEVTA